MKHYFLIISFLIILVFLSAGCAVKSDNQWLSSATETYQMRIYKSATNIKTISISDTETSDIEKLLSNSNITYKKEIIAGQEKLTKLNGVIATASKKWNLYINDNLVTNPKLDSIVVNPQDKIEWRYE